MDLKSRRLLLEAYGLIRMVFGVSQLVGLTAGFFLLEFILRYTSQSFLYVIDRDILTLTYLAVLLRSVFHTVVGIGVARVRAWAKYWLYFGWPLMLLITWGMLFAVSQEWIQQGITGSVLASVSFPKLLLYLGVIAFDVFVVAGSISQIHEAARRGEESAVAMEFKKVGIVFVLAVVMSAVFLFFARPLQKGFHKGFYKTGGEKTETMTVKKEIKAPQVPPAEVRGRDVRGTEIKEEKAKKDAGETFQPMAASVVIEKQEKVRRGVEVDKKTREPFKERGSPAYRTLIGYLAGLFIFFALLLQFFEVGSILGFSAFLVGFFLLAFYGMSKGDPALSVPGSLCAVASLILVFVRIQQKS